MSKTPRGRPRVYDIPFPEIYEALSRHLQIRLAANALGCPESVISYRLRQLGLTAWQVMQSGSIEELLHEELVRRREGQ